MKASILQGSLLEPLWNTYSNDILQLIPGTNAYPDDYTLTFSCKRRESHSTVTRINQALQSITSWARGGRLLLP